MKRALWLAVMVLCVVEVVLAWSLTLRPGPGLGVSLHEGGRLLAILGFVLLSFQYLWVSKIRFVDAGISAGRLLTLHRRFGVVAMALLVLHPASLIISERLQGYPSSMGPLKTMGVIALVFLLAAGGAALFSRRLHLKVRTWKAIHRLGYAVLPMAFVHSLLLGTTLQKTAARAVWVILAVIYLAHLLQRGLRRSHRHEARREGITE